MRRPPYLEDESWLSRGQDDCNVQEVLSNISRIFQTLYIRSVLYGRFALYDHVLYRRFEKHI